MWPSIEKHPIKIKVKFKYSDSQYKNNKKTGINPLNISNVSTDKANFFFPVLRTFVAPTFPEPIFLISPNPNRDVRI